MTGLVKHSAAGHTLVELAMAALIAGLLAGIGLRASRLGVASERAHSARLRLQAIWSSEKRFYAWKGRFTEDWRELALPDQAAEADPWYRYEIKVSEGAKDFRLRAVPARAGLAGFSIDRSGRIVTDGVRPPSLHH